MNKSKASLRLVLLGNVAEKTYFLRRYIAGKDESHELVVGYIYQQIKFDAYQQTVSFGIFDTSQNQIYLSTQRQLFKTNSWFVIFYNFSSSRGSQYLNRLLGQLEYIEEVRVLLIGCHCKNRDERVQTFTLEQIKSKYKKKIIFSDLSIQIINMKEEFQKIATIFKKFMGQCLKSKLESIVMPIKALTNNLRADIQQLNTSSIEKLQSDIGNLFDKKQKISQAILIDILFRLYDNQRRKNEENQITISQLTSEKKQLELALNNIHQKSSELLQKNDAYSKKIAELEEQKMACQYWIVEMERLHRSLEENIQQSVFKHKFDQFRNFANQIDKQFDEKMKVFDEAAFNMEQRGAIIEDNLASNVKKKRYLFYEQELQKLEEIVQVLSPKMINVKLL